MLRASGDALTQVTWDGVDLLPSLFAAESLSGPLPPAVECYTRGVDRFSLHPRTDEFPFRAQLGWSATPLKMGGIALTLTVSLQTDLLDARPGLSFRTTGVATSEPVESPTGELHRVLNGPTLQVCLAPHPTDAAECSASSSAGIHRLEFSPPFLEKGVIRRARVAALFLGSDQPVEPALAEFAAAPLPLTA